MMEVTSAAPVPSLRRLLGLLTAALVLAILLAGGGRWAAAEQGKGPQDAVAQLADQAIDVLVDPALDSAARRDRFRELLHQGFDLDAISRFVLGRFGPRTTPEEQDQFRDLFVDFLIASYVNKLETYSGETLEVTSDRRTGVNKALVGSRLALPSGEPIEVAWHLRHGDEGWRIVDVVIEGVSLAVTIRSEFVSVMRARGGVAGLIERLRQVTANAG